MSANSHNHDRSRRAEDLDSPALDRLLRVALVCLTLVVYLQTSRFDFVTIDDSLYVTGNSRVLAGLSWDNVRWAFETTSTYNWAPLNWLSYMLDATLYGDWAGGYHLTNVVLHACNVLLLFSCLQRATDHSLRSAFVAALFAIHPLHVESVAWISERKDVLSLLFGFISMDAYLRYVSGRRAAWYAAALIAFAASLMTKATLVTFPCVLLLLDYWPLGRWGRFAENATPISRRAGLFLLEKLPFALLSAAVCWITAYAQSAGGAMDALEPMPLAVRFENAILAYGLYLRDAVWPVGLAAFYPHPGSDINFTSVAIAGAALLAVTLAVLFQLRSRPFLIVGWLWYLGTLIPMIGLVQVGMQQRADRYTYFPLVGIYIAVAWLTSPLLRKMTADRRFSAALGTCVVAVFAALAYTQVGVWRNGAVLLETALARTPDNTFVRGTLGDSLLAAGRTDDAIAQYQRAIELAPDDAGQYIRLGEVFEKQKRFDEAVAHYQAALTVNPRSTAAHNRLGMVHVARRHYRVAALEFQAALDIDPSCGLSYAGLSSLCRARGDFAQSIEFGEHALDLDERLVVCHRVIALNLRDQGRYDEAIDRLEVALDEAPHDELAKKELANLLAVTGQRPNDTY